jgi:hypothetical protein
VRVCVKSRQTWKKPGGRVVSHAATYKKVYGVKCIAPLYISFVARSSSHSLMAQSTTSSLSSVCVCTFYARLCIFNRRPPVQSARSITPIPCPREKKGCSLSLSLSNWGVFLLYTFFVFAFYNSLGCGVYISGAAAAAGAAMHAFAAWLFFILAGGRLRSARLATLYGSLMATITSY